MVLGLLLGNTSLRYGLFDKGLILESGRIPWMDLEARAPEMERALGGRRVSEMAAASVRDDLLPLVERILPRGLPVLLLARRDFPIPIENRYERPLEAGTDRLLNALAAHERSPGTGSIVVDFGSAISLSVVSPEGAFLGGLIAAGAGALQIGVKEATPRLPAVQIELPRGFLQRASGPALQAGLYWQVVGGVRAMVRGLIEELSPARPRVLATGGGAAIFAPAVAEVDAVVPDLTLEGLHLALRRRREST